MKEKNRRQIFVETLGFSKKYTFDQIVKLVVGFSRNEIAMHLAIMLKRKQAHAESFDEVKVYVLHEPFNLQKAVRSYNLFMYGTEFPVHTSNYGTLNPGNRYHRGLLDP